MFNRMDNIITTVMLVIFIGLFGIGFISMANGNFDNEIARFEQTQNISNSHRRMLE